MIFKGLIPTWPKAQLHASLSGLEVHPGNQLDDARPIDLHHQGVNQGSHPRIRGVREVALQRLLQDVKSLQEMVKLSRCTLVDGGRRSLEGQSKQRHGQGEHPGSRPHESPGLLPQESGSCGLLLSHLLLLLSFLFWNSFPAMNATL